MTTLDTQLAELQGKVSTFQTKLNELYCAIGELQKAVGPEGKLNQISEISQLGTLHTATEALKTQMGQTQTEIKDAVGKIKDAPFSEHLKTGFVKLLNMLGDPGLGCIGHRGGAKKSRKNRKARKSKKSKKSRKNRKN